MTRSTIVCAGSMPIMIPTSPNWRSRSISSVLRFSGRGSRPPARPAEIVDLPTPPLGEKTVMTRPSPPARSGPHLRRAADARRVGVEHVGAPQREHERLGQLGQDRHVLHAVGERLLEELRRAARGHDDDRRGAGGLQRVDVLGGQAVTAARAVEQDIDLLLAQAVTCARSVDGRADHLDRRCGESAWRTSARPAHEPEMKMRMGGVFDMGRYLLSRPGWRWRRSHRSPRPTGRAS